jgi:hypothetical protein
MHLRVSLCITFLLQLVSAISRERAHERALFFVYDHYPDIEMFHDHTDGVSLILPIHKETIFFAHLMANRCGLTVELDDVSSQKLYHARPWLSYENLPEEKARL